MFKLVRTSIRRTAILAIVATAIPFFVLAALMMILAVGGAIAGDLEWGTYTLTLIGYLFASGLILIVCGFLLHVIHW